MIKVLTSFMKLATGEGARIAYTYSEVNENTGEVIEQNKKGNFMVLDETLSSHIKAIEDYIKENKLS